MDMGEDDLRTLSIHLRDDPVTFLKGTAPMAWIYLLLAGLMEVVWVFAMKQSAGFSRPGYSALTLLCMIGSVVLLAVSVKSLPLGTAYGVWTGIGALGAMLIGAAVFGESLSALRLTALCLIVAGILLLKIAA